MTSLGPSTITTEDWPLVRSMTSGEDVVDEECFNVLPDGTRMMIRASSSPIYDDEDGSSRACSS